MNVFHHARLQIKKWTKLIPKISMVVECVDVILKKKQQLYFCLMYLNADSSYENKNGKTSKLLTSSVILFVTSIYHYPNSPCTSYNKPQIKILG